MPGKEAPWVEPVVLEGKFVRLEPLKPKHARGLAQYAEADLFKYFGALLPREQSVSALKEYVSRHRAQANVLGFAIIPMATMRAAGSTSYMDIRAEHHGIEIGMTWLGREWQGSAINPECKLLLLEHAFERLGAERVQLKTDARNLQSQRAIEKLGAVREGVLRRHVRMPDGYRRDSVMYSIVPDEWPAIKDRLLLRLSAFSKL